ncbi:MAG TPA: DUF2630 family protein [Nitrospira sp.]|nr:DUF2630 family protein [Nitrospira sp.]
MPDRTTDGSVLRRIEELVSLEHRLQTQESMTEDERGRLKAIQVELDQSWDLLRQRRALRAAGQDPDKAQVRPADIVEKYVE